MVPTIAEITTTAIALPLLDIARIVACIAMLSLAAIIDFKKREIPDKIWAYFGILGILLTIFQLVASSVSFVNVTTTNSSFALNSALTASLIQYTIGIGIIFPIAYVIYRVGLFGGADSKALIAIALLVPPYSSISILTMPLKTHGVVALTVLTNALILSLGNVVYNIARNSFALARGSNIFEGFVEEGRLRKALAFAMGFTSASPKGYLFAMEEISESGKRKFRFHPASYYQFIEEEKQLENSINSNKYKNKNYSSQTMLHQYEEGEITNTIGSKNNEDLSIHHNNNIDDNGKEEENNEDAVVKNFQVNTFSSGKNNKVWVTSALPFIVYIAFGFGVMLVIGDLMGLAIHIAFTR